VIVETEHGLSTAVQALLSGAGSTRYRERDLRRTNKACWDWIAKDHLAPSHDLTAPFFDFIAVAKGIAIFSFFTDQFEIYIVRVDDQDEVVRTVKSFAMSDVGPCRAYLTSVHGKATPDVVASRPVAHLWMES